MEELVGGETTTVGAAREDELVGGELALAGAERDVCDRVRMVKVLGRREECRVVIVP